MLEGLLERSLTDGRRSGTVYTPGFLVRWMAREAVSSWLASRLPAPRNGNEEAGLLRNIRVLDLSAGAGAFTMGTVSYTHLDVYKRQGVRRMAPRF